MGIEKRVRRRYLAARPVVGTDQRPASLHLQQRSPYYWWWAYLKRNSDYIDCCNRGGAGKLARLYRDFGDVRSDDFRDWWLGDYERGPRLFAEEPFDLRLKVVTIKDLFNQDWADNEKVAFFAVNMTIGRRKLQQLFAAALARHHTGRRGRVAVGDTASTAKYSLYRNVSQHNLRSMLETYDAWLENAALPTAQRVPQWAIGESIRLVANAMPRPRDTAAERTAKHSVMSTAVSRYIKQAKAIIANVAAGEFPNSVSPPETVAARKRAVT